uniref:Uncharacterized protein n=1 Tax=Magallana gigas TaxID=29159 RepID=A0A8W8HRP4_MAGGI
MSMSTTLRFELNTGNNMKDAFLKQQERIQKDEMMAERENIVRLEKNTNLRAEWNENLEKVSWNKRIQNENKKIQDEVRLAAKAAIAVRRKALQQLIQKEIDMYEQELSLLVQCTNSQHSVNNDCMPQWEQLLTTYLPPSPFPIFPKLCNILNTAPSTHKSPYSSIEVSRPLPPEGP